MYDQSFWQQWYWRTLVMESRGPDWPTLLALLLIGGFLFVPPVLGHTLSYRARFCFMAAAVFLVLNLGVGLVKLSLAQYEGYRLIVDDRAPPYRDEFAPRRFEGEKMTSRPPNSPSPVLLVIHLCLPVLQSGFFILAMFLFLIGLPGQVRRKPPLATPADILVNRTD